MSAIVAILILLLLAAVILVVAAPLRGGDAGAGGQPSADEGAHPLAGAREQAPAELRHGQGEQPASVVRDELEAAREAKYREIRDSELDYRTGKLSAEDYAAVDAQLRAEAIEILNRLEAIADDRHEPPPGRDDEA
jgi:hypothetical protein